MIILKNTLKKKHTFPLQTSNQFLGHNKKNWKENMRPPAFSEFHQLSGGPIYFWWKSQFKGANHWESVTIKNFIYKKGFSDRLPLSAFFTIKIRFSTKIIGSTRKLVKFWESKRPQTFLFSFFFVPQKLIWNLKGKSVFFQCIFWNFRNNAPFTMLFIVFCLQQYINLRQGFLKCTGLRKKLHPIIPYVVIFLIV